MSKIPKLSSNMAAKVEEAEGGDFTPVPEGIYVLMLTDCEVKTPQDEKKNPYWSWVFKIPEGEEHAGRKFWSNTSTGEDALWKMNETFTAFGVPADTDTDVLIGQKVRAMIVQKISNFGTRKGEMVNEIKTLLPLDPAKEKKADHNGVRRSKAADPGDVPLY